jgi:hypothetical protein
MTARSLFLLQLGITLTACAVGYNLRPFIGGWRMQLSYCFFNRISKIFGQRLPVT